MRNTIDVLYVDSYMENTWCSQEFVADAIQEWTTLDWDDRIDIPENCEVVWYDSHDILLSQTGTWELNGTLWIAEIVPDPENDARYLVCRVCREGFLEADDWKQHAAGCEDPTISETDEPFNTMGDHYYRSGR